MCNLSQGIEQKGIEKGRKIGIEKGIVTSIVNIMNSLKLSAEDAIIAVGIPEAKRDDYITTVTKILSISLYKCQHQK